MAAATLRLRLLLQNIRSLWNVGSMFRTSDAFGVEFVHLTGYTGTPPRKEIAKTALGAEAWIPWDHHADPLEVMQKLAADGWDLVALELTPDAVDIASYQPGPKTCLIVGHEVSGVDPAVLKLCKATVKIPMQGLKESLNVSVATGIALATLRRA